MSETAREKILARLHSNLSAIVAGEPVDDPYNFTPSRVSRGPLGDFDSRKRLVIGIVDSEEQKKDRFPLVECFLRVVIEFQLSRNQGEAEPSVLANRMLGDLQRKIGEDTTLGGLAIDVKEVGSDVDLESDNDKSIEGALFVVVQYRHAHNDPRK